MATKSTTNVTPFTTKQTLSPAASKVTNYFPTLLGAKSLPNFVGKWPSTQAQNLTGQFTTNKNKTNPRIVTTPNLSSSTQKNKISYASQSNPQTRTAKNAPNKSFLSANRLSSPRTGKSAQAISHLYKLTK